MCKVVHFPCEGCIHQFETGNFLLHFKHTKQQAKLKIEKLNRWSSSIFWATGSRLKRADMTWTRKLESVVTHCWCIDLVVGPWEWAPAVRMVLLSSQSDDSNISSSFFIAVTKRNCVPSLQILQKKHTQRGKMVAVHPEVKHESRSVFFPSRVMAAKCFFLVFEPGCSVLSSHWYTEHLSSA